VDSLTTLAEARRQSHDAAEDFGLHRLAVDDAIAAHQRPKLERYGETLFVVLRAAGYVDEAEAVEFGEIHLFVGPGFVITVGHGPSPDLTAVRRRMESEPQLLTHGPDAVLYAVLDSVVDGYAPVVAGLHTTARCQPLAGVTTPDGKDGTVDVSSGTGADTREAAEASRARNEPN
jgi:Mg2+ and Co2+ transporter CorA